LKAGLRQEPQPKSISHLEVENLGDEIVVDSDAADEGEVVEAGDQVERSALEKEGAVHVVRKLIDPKLPSEKEVGDHYVRGHFPYRNWCHICVRVKGRDMGHQKQGGRRGRFLSIILIIVFQEMNWRSSGRSQQERNEFQSRGWLQ
jgi:hypothetical protein